MSPVAVVIAVACAVRLWTLQEPLVEAHSFRQTQTAFTARIFHSEGIDLLYPKLPVLGKPWTVPFEFPLFQALATLPMNLGFSADVATRVTALGFFLLSALLVYLLVRHVTRDSIASLAATAFFCFSPFSLLWARASLIEYMATAGALTMTLFGIMWWDRRQWYLAAVAAVAGVVGMLVKPTTSIWWVFPILSWAMQRCRDEGSSPAGAARSLFHPGLAVVAGPGLLAAAWWTMHADAVKRTTPTTRWLTSDALTTWSFGTIDQRWVAGNWVVVLDRAEQLLVGRYVWFGLALLVLATGPRRCFWWGVALAGVLPVVVFFNLYRAHDYYLAAVSPVVAMLLGAGVGRVAARSASVAKARLTAVSVVAVWLVLSLWTTSGYWSAAYKRGITFPSLAAEISRATKPSDRVVIVGLDWEPTTLYYANRWGTMLVDEVKTSYPTARLLEDLRGQMYRTFVAYDPAVDRIDWAMAWPWVGPISPNVYRVAESPAGLGRVPVLATSEVAAFEDAARRGSVVATDVVVPCDTGVDLKSGRQALWLRFAAVEVLATRIVLDRQVAPLPPVPVAVVPQPAGDVTHISCSGTSSVTITSAVAAPAP